MLLSRKSNDCFGVLSGTSKIDRGTINGFDETFRPVPVTPWIIVGFQAQCSGELFMSMG